MSEFLALSINNNQMIECALAPHSEQLNLRTGDAGSWGLSYYDKGEILQRVEPRDRETTIDVTEVIGGLRADLVVMHTRKATHGAVRSQNVHPFRFQEWIFAHNGTVAGFDMFKDKLLSTMPPFVLRGIRGDTDSEHLFHLFLSFLYDAGQIGRANLGVQAIKDALVRALSTFDEFAKEAGESPSPLSTVISDGYSLVVLSRGIPVDYALVEGVRDCSICRKSIPPGERTIDKAHQDLRAVIVRSGQMETVPAGFQRLETPPSSNGAILMVPQSYSIEFSFF